MITRDWLDSIATKRVVIMGLGLHGGGLSVANWMLKHGASVCITDLRDAKILAPSLKKLRKSKDLQLVLGKHRNQDFAKADLVVQNPGVPNTSPFLETARKHGVPIVNEATLFFALCNAPIVGITGTRGKTTTTTLIGDMLKRSKKRAIVAGNIRTTAMMDVVDTLKKSVVPVLELSSWQLEGLPAIQRSPHVAVVTNLMDDHLNRYGGRRGYFAAKALIWKYQSGNDTVVLNRDIPYMRRWVPSVKSTIYWFSLKRLPHTVDGAFLQESMLYLQMHGAKHPILSVNEIHVSGKHILANILAASIAAYAAGASLQGIRSAVKQFRGVWGRIQPVKTIRGVRYINDTTATSPDAVIAALHSFSSKPILITGGVDKGLPYAALAKVIQKRAKHVVLLPGTASEKLKRYLPKSFALIEVESMHQAVRKASRMAQKGDVVLLSPGAASFNLFLHEFDRGEQFIRELATL